MGKFSMIGYKGEPDEDSGFYYLLSRREISKKSVAWRINITHPYVLVCNFLSAFLFGVCYGMNLERDRTADKIRSSQPVTQQEILYAQELRNFRIQNRR